MLATLNLQFSPLEITDDTLTTPVVAPDSGAMSNAGFADLLRLRIDVAPGSGESAGELLPPAGSDLPLQALTVELETLQGPEISDALISDVDKTALSVETPLEYPLSALEGLEPLTTAATTTATPETALVAAPDLLSGVADRRDLLSSSDLRSLPAAAEGVARPVTQASVQAALATAVDGTKLPAPVLREGPLPGQLQPLTAPVVAGIDANMLLAEQQPRRIETSSLAITSSEEISEVFKPRPVVTQPVQVLNAQPNPQQPLNATLPSASVSTDTGYASAMQQATDLIPTSVRNSAWGEQIGERVLLMAGNQLKSAEIRLTPAELGPLRVQVSVDDGAANVTFQAQHAATREAIEQALPRLREMLAENGLSLGQADVGEQGVNEGNRDEHTDSSDARGDADDALDAGGASEQAGNRSTLSATSLVDTFA